MWSRVVPGVALGVLLGLTIAPAEAAPSKDAPYVSVTKLTPLRHGRMVKAQVAFHQPTLKRRGRDRLHLWLGVRDEGQLSTLWRSKRVPVEGRHSLTLKVPRKKAARLRTSDRLLMTATQRHSEPGSELFATNYVATASVPASGGKLRQGGCPERVIGPGADLSNCDLTGAVLRSADLSDADLTGARLVQTDLRRADLTGARLVYNTSADQAINPKFDEQVDYGYLRSLSATINGKTTELPTSATFTNISTWETEQVVGALQMVAVGPLIEVVAVLGDSPELQALGQVPAGASVRFSLTVYRWDRTTHAYFPTFQTGAGSVALPATFKEAPAVGTTPAYGPPYSGLLHFVVQPAAGCGLYAVQPMPGSVTAVKWGLSC